MPTNDIRQLKKEIVATSNALKGLAANLDTLTIETPQIQPYSQRNPLWRDKVFAGGKTFGQAGCYVVSGTMIASLAGYDDDPVEFAEKLRSAGVFSGPEFAYPQRIPTYYHNLKWSGRINWRNRPADLIRLRKELEESPVIIEVEFRPGGVRPPHDQHFVIAEQFTRDGHDLEIIDPWDGCRTHLLERYALDHWNLARAIYGARLLRPA